MKKKPLTVNQFASLGGHARAASLSKAAMSAIAKKAAAARWKGHVKKSRRAVAVMFLLLSLAAPLSAQENSIRDTSLHIAPFMVIAAGQSADVLMTMKNFQAGCTEANTGAFGSSRPTTARLIGIKAAGVLPAVIITAFLQKSGHQKAANVVGLLAGGIGFAAAGYNLTVRCGH